MSLNIGVAILDQEIIFVMGKGGVGKSTISAAIAKKLSSAGEKVLLAELDDYFIEFPRGEEKTPFGTEQWTGMSCLSEYVDHLIKLKGMGKLFFDNPVMSKLLNIAPGLFELAILGKLTSKQRKHGPSMNYKHLVFDSYATGHSLSMIKAPVVMAESIKRGPMHDQSQGIIDVMNSTAFQPVIVVTPEMMAVEESLELADDLNELISSKPIFIINRSLKEFTELPDPDNPWEAYLYKKQTELDKVRQLLENKGFSYLESELVTESSKDLDFLDKVGEKWKIS